MVKMHLLWYQRDGDQWSKDIESWNNLEVMIKTDSALICFRWVTIVKVHVIDMIIGQIDMPLIPALQKQACRSL